MFILDYQSFKIKYDEFNKCVYMNKLPAIEIKSKIIGR